MNPAQIFARALGHHGRGDLLAALVDYRVLQSLLPQDAAPLANAVMASIGLGRWDSGGRLCRRALLLAPDLAALHRLQGEIAQSLGQTTLAELAFRRAIALHPEAVESYNNFANFQAAWQRDEAIALLHRSLALVPDQPACFANLSAALLVQDRAVEACLAARIAISLAPHQPENCNNLGNALFERRDYPGALQQFRRARRLRPDFTAACINESGLRLDLGDGETGAALSLLAVLLSPDRAGAYNNLANGQLLSCALTAAEASFRRAVQLQPDDAQTHFNFAAVLLKQGRMAEGWREYEWRRRTKAAIARRRRDDPPDWQGEDPGDRVLLLSAEQGFGDTLQFCRFAPWLARRGVAVILRVPPALQRLMNSLPGLRQVIASEEYGGDADLHLPLMSVPALFPTEPIPAPDRYLAADAAAVASWRDRLAAYPGRKIGLVWSGDPRPGQRSAHLLDQRRSMRLDMFAPLASLPGLTLVSVQKGAPAAERGLPGAPDMLDWTDELGDFADSAALITALDLVISVDTAVAHLAGALGRPVWILSRFDGCWRWLAGGSTSPWYPSARLYRQQRPGDWAAPVAAIVADLAALCAPNPQPKL